LPLACVIESAAALALSSNNFPDCALDRLRRFEAVAAVGIGFGLVQPGQKVWVVWGRKKE
jgi:hypothetical protein